jgi:mono/diheme cytochrome c family protein
LRPRGTGLALLAAGVVLIAASAAAQDEDAAIARGEYVFHATACDSCHTDHPNHGAFLAGGRRMPTEFGTFLVPNITPDPATGIGAWSEEDFRDAMIAGEAPDGSHYYPVFPYRWYTGMSAEDLADLWAYLRSVPPVENRVGPHELPFPLDIRTLLLGWKLVNFDQGDTVFDPAQSAAWNRGAYLVNHLGHCGACHTTKLFGAVFLPFKFLAGSTSIPGPYPAPNITPDPSTGLGRWSVEDVVRALGRAITPEGEPIRGPMAEYVASGSGHLAAEDLAAMAIYLRSIPPREGPVSEREERRDRRLQPGEAAQGASATEKAGMDLLRCAVETADGCPRSGS